MSKEQFTADELAGLSDVERAALMNEDGDDGANDGQGDDDTSTPPANTSTNNSAGNDDDDDGDDGDDTGTPPPAAAAPDATTPPAEDDEDEVAAAQRMLMTPHVENYETVVADIQKERDALFAQFNEGDLSVEDYRSKEAALEQKALDVRFQENQAINDENRLEALNAQIWMKQVEKSKNAFKADGIDYDAPENKEMAELWDATVKMLAQLPQNQKQKGEWFLQKAHDVVKLQYNLTGNSSAPAKPATPAKPFTPTSKAGKAPDLSGLPPTLRGAPNARENVDESEFAHLDSLKGYAKEMAVARMTPEQRERYEAA